ncbi:MAG: hypothetical protein R8K50_10340 [Mariprofundus sp.]
MKNIAIIGLGNIGGEILGEKLKRKDLGLNVRCVAELQDTPGKRRAIEAGIPVLSLEEIIALGDGIDVIFDLSNSHDLRVRLREMLYQSGNRYTVIAPENIAHIVWALMTGNPVPDANKDSGY